MHDLIHLNKKQYADWPYPKPPNDISDWQAKGGYQQCDPLLDYELIWPERAYNPEFSILIAGCGTTEAAHQAYNHPLATVVGIDLSPASLEHEARLKKKHGLDNLELRQMDLHDAATLGRQFDLVVSYGVLHRQPDPSKALAALASVVKDDGVIFLALYGKHLRSGVYMVQDALRRLGVGQTPQDVAFARSVVGTLPPWHPVQAYIPTVDDLDYDSGFVDTFLHNRDIPYTVPDVLALADSCDLAFQGWFDNLFYYPDGALSANPPLYRKVATLPEREQWAVVELLVPPFSGHRFFLRKKNEAAAKFRIDFDSPSFLETVPSSRQFLKAGNIKPGVTGLSREWHRMQLSGLERAVFLATDGEASIGEIIARQAGSSTENQESALRFFKRMWRLGHVKLSKAPRT